MNWCYFNGRITASDKIKISPWDIGLLRGYAVFDVMRTASGKPFLAKEHFSRLKKSADYLKLKLPFSQAEFEKNIIRLLKLNKAKDVSVRTVITGGVSRDSFSPGSKPTSLIVIEKWHKFPAEAYKKGARLMVLENCLNAPEAKMTINYTEAIKCQSLKRKSQAHEILYINKGKVLECSTSNIFMVKNKTIITPKEKILYGTTRNLVIRLARDKFKTEEGKITEKELYNADEVFLTATSKGIVPVTRIGKVKIAGGPASTRGDDRSSTRGGEIGPITKELMKRYNEFVKSY